MSSLELLRSLWRCQRSVSEPYKKTASTDAFVLGRQSSTPGLGSARVAEHRKRLELLQSLWRCQRSVSKPYKKTAPDCQHGRLGAGAAAAKPLKVPKVSLGTVQKDCAWLLAEHALVLGRSTPWVLQGWLRVEKDEVVSGAAVGPWNVPKVSLETVQKDSVWLPARTPWCWGDKAPHKPWVLQGWLSREKDDMRSLSKVSLETVQKDCAWLPARTPWCWAGKAPHQPSVLQGWLSREKADVVAGAAAEPLKVWKGSAPLPAEHALCWGDKAPH